MSEWRYRKGDKKAVEVTTSPGIAAWLPIALIAIGFIAVLGFFLISNTQTARVDACLDAGGSFDYERDACDHKASRPGP